MTADEQPLIRSARAIVINDSHVLLIERHRAGHHYFVFPGGSIEAGETPQAAVVREVEEETGLIVRPTLVVADVSFPDRVQTFWLAEITRGTFGAGQGPEMTGGTASDRGSYHPVWLALDIVAHNDVYPERIAAELVQRGAGGWNAPPLRFSDPYMWWQ